jgi:hypothetical protein
VRKGPGPGVGKADEGGGIRSIESGGGGMGCERSDSTAYMVRMKAVPEERKKDEKRGWRELGRPRFNRMDSFPFPLVISGLFFFAFLLV